ncbi:ISAs1 family transposase [Myxosarcina sp. GI1]|uniref:ISAs1 family transposase n=1 Tax=Myxosarcina sp. GI1 TaxID=1541065 RepID=UPI00055EE538
MAYGFARKIDLEKQNITAKQTLQEWVTFFETLEDPRGKQGREHDFLSIVMIAILAVIAGAEGWDDIELYAESHQVWLEELLELKNGVPHADTYRRVFALINPESLQSCFLSWVKQIIKETKGEIIAIDGKQSRGSYNRNQKKSALHVVSAWSNKNRLVLGQVKVKDKSNEITAIPALLELLDINGCIVTLDAMGTQTEIADLIIQQGGDYVLSLKANHPTLLDSVKQCFNPLNLRDGKEIISECSHESKIEAGHHRLEKRFCWVLPVIQIKGLYQQEQWNELKTIVMVNRERHLWNKIQIETQFYLSSLSCDAKLISRAIRQHWGIENQLHWILDVTFNEDSSRIRQGHSPENFTLLRRMAISLLNQETNSKRSLRQKTKRAAMNCNYMFDVLLSALK